MLHVSGNITPQHPLVPRVSFSSFYFILSMVVLSQIWA